MATAIAVRELASVLPRAATLYAIKELARRAGVSPEFFRTWRVEFETPGWATIYLEAGSKKKIRFPHAGPQFWRDARMGYFQTATFQWMEDPGALRALVPDFKVPFSTVNRENALPLFSPAGTDCVECAVDLPASTLLTLSRFEETLEQPRDAHGRSSAVRSIAWRDGFLYRPIVDEYGLALSQAIAFLLPRWEGKKRELSVKLGHDVDEIGLPFSLRSSLAHALRRRQPVAALRDFVAPIAGTHTTYLMLLRKLVSLSREHGLDASVYWKAARPGLHDTGYDLNDSRIASLISTFQMLGFEMGIHPSYDSFESEELFRTEVGELQRVIGKKRIGGRQDFLRWSPSCWRRWESAGLGYDASVGYADQIGFRAGTCHPYQPWLLAECREADLLEIPLLVMDATLIGYMKLEPEQILTRVRDCVARCRAVGGVFTLLWHNTTFMDRRLADTYRILLDDLAGSNRFDWSAFRDDN